MQRVRIGLTGLAFVFLLVLLGSVFRSASQNSGEPGNAAGRQLASAGEASANQTEASEPLAELGVAPGSSDTNSSSGSSTTSAPRH